MQKLLIRSTLILRLTMNPPEESKWDCMEVSHPRRQRILSNCAPVNLVSATKIAHFIELSLDSCAVSSVMQFM